MNTFKYIVDKYKISIDGRYIIDIPNIGRDNLAELFEELEFDTGAEIGVENGFFSETLLKANPRLHLYAIDPWSTGAYEPGIDAIDTEQEKYDIRYEGTVKRLSKYDATIIRKCSLDALNHFDDNSLDFVYIDGNHDFPNFINDLHQWIKKVRPGGIVSGHDYANYPFRKKNHVKRALQAYARSYRMIPLFIVGAESKADGLIRDRYRSWFWVKE